MDREKVIRAIEGCINIYDYCNVCDYDGCVFNHGSCEKDLLADALALLKEQEAVVRCKDCKHGKIHGIDVECVAHEEVSYDPEPWHPLDWFCADGERRTDDA